MKFLIDAQLPRRMSTWFNTAGCDAVHALDLPQRNRTPDHSVVEIADRNQQVVVTKDTDFVTSHLLFNQPAMLLLVTTGYISNQELEQLLMPLIHIIAAEFQVHSFMELDRLGLIMRGKPSR